MMKRTLGGDRLGVGNKMQVEMHGYERSNHNIGYVFRNTQSPGTIVPIFVEPALPGTTFDIEFDLSVMTKPTNGPCFGGAKIEIDVFQAPIRLYQRILHNNQMKIGLNPELIKFPVIELLAPDYTPDAANYDLDNSQINPSSIFKYIGISGVGLNTTGEVDLTRKFNAIPFLMYWDTVKNYYTNKQEEVGAVIHGGLLINPISTITYDGGEIGESPATAVAVISSGTSVIINYTGTSPNLGDIQLATSFDGGLTYAWITMAVLGFTTLSDTGTVITAYWSDYDLGFLYVNSWRFAGTGSGLQQAPKIEFYPLENLDTMRMNILSASTSVPFNVNAQALTPYSWALQRGGGISAAMNTQEGLAVKTYMSDLLNNWLNTEWIDQVNELSSVSTVGGSFTMDAIQFAKKMYDYMNRVAVAGATWEDWLDATYTDRRYRHAETPMFCGGVIQEIGFQEVVSNAATQTQPLGTLAGRGTLASRKKGGKVIVKTDTPSYVMALMHITPRLDYTQGNKWDIYLETMDDFHKPQFDQLGFQELMTYQMAWWDTKRIEPGEWVSRSAGKQPAWLNYMTNINRAYGNFAIENSEMFMIFARRYELDKTALEIKDLTTYIDPSKFNYIFADSSLDAMNYWVQVAIQCNARRLMSGKLMPNL